MAMSEVDVPNTLNEPDQEELRLEVRSICTNYFKETDPKKIISKIDTLNFFKNSDADETYVYNNLYLKDLLKTFVLKFFDDETDPEELCWKMKYIRMQFDVVVEKDISRILKTETDLGEIIRCLSLLFEEYEKNELGDFRYQRWAFGIVCCWCVPTFSSLLELSKFIGKREVIEINAGLGFVAMLLSKMGVNILAFDITPNSRYFQVRKERSRDVLKRKIDVLMTIWPHTNEDEDIKYVYDNFEGNCLIYVGKEKGKDTAYPSEKFEQSYKLIKTLPVTPYLARNEDQIYIYVKNI